MCASARSVRVGRSNLAVAEKAARRYNKVFLFFRYNGALAHEEHGDTV